MILSPALTESSMASENNPYLLPILSTAVSMVPFGVICPFAVRLQRQMKMVKMQIILLSDVDVILLFIKRSLGIYWLI